MKESIAADQAPEGGKTKAVIEAYGADIQVFEGEALAAHGPWAQFRCLDQPLRGVELRLGGSARELLEINELSAYVPHGEGRWSFSFDKAVDDAPRCVFPQARTEEAAPADSVPDDSDVAAMEARLCAENRASLAFSLSGRARVAGQGSLEFSLWSMDGQPLASVDVPLDVQAAPRQPELPPGHESPNAGSSEFSRWLDLCDAHDNPDYAALLLRFGGSLEDRQELIDGSFIRWTTDLCRILSAFSGADLALELRAGARASDCAAPFGVESDLRDPLFGDVLSVLRIGGELRARPTDHCETSGNITVRHRGGLGPDASLELGFCIPQPELDASCDLISGVFTTSVEVAARTPLCLGAWAGALGAHWEVGEALPYQLLVDLSGPGALPSGVSPGWRVLVPSVHFNGDAEGGSLSSTHLQVTEAQAGVLLACDAPDPFSMQAEDWSSCERGLLAALKGLRADSREGRSVDGILPGR